MAQRGRRNIASSVRGLARSRKANKNADAPADTAADDTPAESADPAAGGKNAGSGKSGAGKAGPGKGTGTGSGKAAGNQSAGNQSAGNKAGARTEAPANGSPKSNGAKKAGGTKNGKPAEAKPTEANSAKSAAPAPDDKALDDNTPTTELPAVTDGETPAKAIPEAAVGRMAIYLRVLSSMQEQGTATVSSEELSAAAGVNSAKLRKDLSYIGSYGTRGVGYEVEVLIGQLERTLGLNKQQRVAVVGIGNLGHALANYGGFPGRGFPVEALFDIDSDLIGIPVGGLPVSHLDDIPEVCAEREISIGVIATPPTAAQTVCDRLVAGGVQCILNFAPVVLSVPEHIEVRKVDLAAELQILSFHVARRADGKVNGQTAGAETGSAEGATSAVVPS